MYRVLCNITGIMRNACSCYRIARGKFASLKFRVSRLGAIIHLQIARGGVISRTPVSVSGTKHNPDGTQLSRVETP
jgi:hypothetical protein